MAVSLLCLEIVSVVMRCAYPEYRTDVTTAAVVLDLVSAFSIATIVYVEHRRGIRASALLSLYIAIGILIDGTKTRSYFLREISSLGSLCATTTSLRFVLLCLQEVPKTDLLIDPAVRDASGREETSGFWGRTFFVFMSPLFRNGFRKILSVDDLGNLGVEFSSSHIMSKFSPRWTRARQEKPHSLFLTCLKTWQGPLLAIAFPRLCAIGFRFAQPFVLRHMVLSHREQNSSQAKGGLVAATFFAYTGAAVCKAASMHLNYRLLTRIRGGLISQLLDKTQRLELSQAKKQAAITLISTDIDGIITGLPPCIDIGFAVIETGLGMYFLTEFVQKAAFIIFIPLAFATFMGILYGKHITPALRFWNQNIEARVAKTSRVLAQLPGIKMLGLGPKMTEFLQHLRIEEIKSSRRYRLIQGASISTVGGLDMSTPVVVIAGALFWRVFGEKLSSDVVFPTLGLVSLVQNPISNLLKSYPSAMAMLGCFSRIQDYLCQEEHDDPRVLLGQATRDVARHWPTVSGVPVFATRTVRKDPSRVIHFENTSLAPLGVKVPLLRNTNLSIAPGSVTAVFGQTGSGKTSFLHSILGEAEVLEGIVYVDDLSIALCGQTIWLPNMTVMECIVGALEYDPVWFRTVITACRLVEDIEQFEGGEHCVIGSGGMKLSGGQRQRVCMARAVYARTSIILLDDAFSSLDRPTATAILFDLCGRDDGLLRQSGCTVLMASYLPECLDVADDVIFLDGNGSISHRPIDAVDNSFIDLIMAMLYEENLIAPDERDEIGLHAESESDSETESEINSQYAGAATSFQSSNTAQQHASITRVPEGRQKGDSKLYSLWINQVGRRRLLPWLALVLVMCVSEGFPTIYMKWWIDAAPTSRVFFVGYALLAATAGLLGGPCVFIMMVRLSPRACIGLHGCLSDVVMRSTLGFLGDTDSGSILNRYSVDMDLIAKHIPAGVYNNLYFGITTLIQICIAVAGANYMIALMPVIIALLFVVQRYYLRTSRQLRHLEIENQAPLATSFRETADGVVYIRGFGWQAHTLGRSLRLLDESQKPFYLLSCAQQLLSLVLDCITSGIATVLALLTLFVDDSSTENSTGLAFLVLIILGTSFNRSIMAWTTLETALGSLSRLSVFLDKTPVESDDGTTPLPENWPSQGEVEVRNVSARYCNTGAEEQVLRNVSLSIKPGQKIGIMGRTGSGKSSLLKSILGFLDYEGSILIDGIDIRTAPRDQLRSKIITISQDQIEFEGTIRDSLLPFDKNWNVQDKTEEKEETQGTDIELVGNKDQVLRETLMHLRIWEPLENKSGLSTLLADAGFSHGEMQLLCIARAVVRRRLNGGNLVLVDEATGGMDRWRDRIVWDVMNDFFQGCTILIVAHRRESIGDSNVIVKMAEGRVIGQRRIS